jgi:hypothetical protein
MEGISKLITPGIIGNLVHEQIRLPTLIDRADEMPDERYVVGLHRPAKQPHVRIFRRAVALPVVAFHARRYEIFPCVFAFSRLRDNVINSQTDIGSSAILAAVAITPEDIFSRKDNFLVWNVYIHTQSDYTGEWHGIRHRSNALPVMRFDQLRLAEP